MNTKSRAAVTLLVSMLAIGCSKPAAIEPAVASATADSAIIRAPTATEAAPATTVTVETTASAEPPPTKHPDTVFMLDRMRENLTSSEWAIAKTPLTWSTFTADVGDTFTAETAATTWRKWTQVPTAITKPANDEIKQEFDAAIAAAEKSGRPVEREFDFNGFRFVVTASNGDSADTTFVRVSFMDSRYAN